MTNWKNTYNLFIFHADFHTSNNVPWVDHNFEHVCVIGVGETIWCFNITYENTVSVRALCLVAFNDNLVFCCLFFVFRNVCCCYYCIPLKTNILLCCLGQGLWRMSVPCWLPGVGGQRLFLRLAKMQENSWAIHSQKLSKSKMQF